MNDTDLFGDAIALEDPVQRHGQCAHLHGLPDPVPVNIIFWRGDLAQPQNIVAGGIGTVQVSPDAASQNIQRYQSWAKSVWTVIVTRPMAASSDNPDHVPPGATYRIAFANWNGSGSNRNGLKGESRGGIALRCSNGLRSRNI